MLEEKNGLKVGQKVVVRTYSEDGHFRKKEEYTVEKMYTSVVLLRKDNGIKICPSYPQLRWLMMDKKQRDATAKPVDGKRIAAQLPKDKKYTKLNHKQVSFCRWYLKNGDGQKAMKIAGYGSTEPQHVARLLSNQNVQECLEDMRKEMGM